MHGAGDRRRLHRTVIQPATATCRLQLTARTMEPPPAAPSSPKHQPRALRSRRTTHRASLARTRPSSCPLHVVGEAELLLHECADLQRFAEAHQLVRLLEAALAEGVHLPGDERDTLG